MPGLAIVGAQWGDEGKGKVTDLLAEQADVVIRFQGGNNAGHTIVRGSDVYRLHLIPSGILYPGKLCLIGNGVVVDPRVITEELEELRRRGVDTSGLRISANAHMIMPYHLLLDQEGETKLGKLQIGTTRRGIGPCYADKAARLGIRMQDLLDEKILRQKIYAAMEPKRQTLRPFAKDPSIDLHTMTEDYRTLGHRLEPYIADTQRIVWDSLDRNQLVVFEGAQGTLLDIDHGTYPFVTSSNPVAGAACVGAGVGPKDIEDVWGVAKAYVTRVGAGPFPTELEGDLGDRMREAGGEFGTTTGRPRRCRLARPGRAPLRRPPERPHRPRGHEAGRAHRASTRSASAWSTRAPRAPPSASSPTTSRSSTRRRGSTPSCPAGKRTSPALAAWTTCPRRRATTSSTSRSTSTCLWCWWASDPAAIR